jgi:hypothetical protein
VPGIALVFPPHWYYASVPTDLLLTGSFLRARGLAVRAHDLSAGLMHHLLGRNSGYQALRRFETYADDGRYDRAGAELAAALALLSCAHGVEYDLYRLAHPGVDTGHVPTALAVGLDPARNPALTYLRDVAVPRVLAADPDVVAVALVHGDQILQVPVVGRLLRRAGFRGRLVLYGAHEDVVAPEDFAEDLVGEPRHLLYDDYDGIVIGEAESALAALGAGRAPAEVASVLVPGGREPPPARAEDVTALPPLDYTLVEDVYPFPAPMIDLRLSRSCPWGRCTFCAIRAHEAGYRARPTAEVARDLVGAHRALGATFFRFRDDLLTPAQLGELAALVPSLPFRPRWTARTRFDPGLTRALLADAAAAGLEELWLGLESAVPRVRNLMVKGVAQGVVERVLADAAAVGLRVRLLCILGYPGERLDEALATIEFVERHRERIATVGVTPFHLMRNSPLARAPARHGLRLRPDARPRHERLRHELSADQDGLTPVELARVVRLATTRLAAPVARASSGPSLAHAWMRASLRRRALDAPTAG